MAFLKSQQFFGGECLPTENNVDYFLSLGYDQVRRNKDPHLVCEMDNHIVGFIQIGAAFSSLERKYKTCEMFSIYIKPEYQHKFVSIELLRGATDYVLTNGYKRGYSTIILSNDRIIKNVFYNPSMWPTRVFMEWDIEADPQFQDGKQLIQFLERQDKK